MKRLFYFFFVVSLMFIISCDDGSDTMADSRVAEIEMQVMGQMDALNASVESADADGYAKFFSTEGFIGMYSDGISFAGRNDYLNAVREWFGQRESAGLQDKTLVVNVLDDDLALVDQQSKFRANFTADSSMTVNHAVSFLFMKEDSGWMIVHGHESWNMNE